MENHQESTKEVLCPICEKNVQAHYFGIKRIGKNKMHHYECPNEETPGERHGFLQTVIEKSPTTEEAISSLKETSPLQCKSPITDEESVLQDSPENFSAKENSWITMPSSQLQQEKETRSWARRAFEIIGIYETLKAIFSSPEPAPSPEGEAAALVSMHQPQHDFILPNHEEPAALLEALPASGDDIPDLDEISDFGEVQDWFEGFAEALTSF